MIPGLYDGVRLQPCAVIRWRGSSPTGLLISERRAVHIHLYQDVGRDAIQAAKLYLKRRDVLHRVTIGADNVGLNHFHFAGDLGERVAEEFGGASEDVCRFWCDYTRLA
jgi:hypothetical protein